MKTVQVLLRQQNKLIAVEFKLNNEAAKIWSEGLHIVPLELYVRFEAGGQFENLKIGIESIFAKVDNEWSSAAAAMPVKHNSTYKKPTSVDVFEVENAQILGDWPTIPTPPLGQVNKNLLLLLCATKCFFDRFLMGFSKAKSSVDWKGQILPLAIRF